MTNLDKVIRNLENELEQLKRINTMLKSDELREVYLRSETRVGKDLDALDFDCYDNQTRGAEIQRDAIMDSKTGLWKRPQPYKHSKHYYDYDRNR